MTLKTEQEAQERLARELGVRVDKAPKPRGTDNPEVERLAATVIGVLAGASSQDVRRRAVERARRMLGTR